MSDHEHRFHELTRRHGTVAAVLMGLMILLYFGFVLLIAYNKPLMARLLRPGLSVGILLGALVIIVSWLLTWAYSHWANTHYDRAVDHLRR